MESSTLPETLALPLDKTLEARMEAASHYPGVKEHGLTRSWSPSPDSDLEIEVNSEKQTDGTVHDIVYSVTFKPDATNDMLVNPAGGPVKIVTSLDGGMMVLQPNGEGLITDSTRHARLIGYAAAKLGAALEAAQPEPAQPARIVSLLGRLVGRSETELADVA